MKQKVVICFIIKINLTAEEDKFKTFIKYNCAAVRNALRPWPRESFVFSWPIISRSYFLLLQFRFFSSSPRCFVSLFFIVRCQKLYLCWFYAVTHMPFKSETKKYLTDNERNNRFFFLFSISINEDKWVEINNMRCNVRKICEKKNLLNFIEMKEEILIRAAHNYRWEVFIWFYFLQIENCFHFYSQSTVNRSSIVLHHAPMSYDVKETSCWTWVIVSHARFKRFEIGSSRVSQSYVILFVHWSGRLFGSKNPDYHSNTAAADVNGKMKQETFSHFRVQQKIPGLLYHEPILLAPKPWFFCCH